MNKRIGKILTERGLRIAVAESCTGGLIGNLITNVPGSSLYFSGGVIVYSNESKIKLLRIPMETIEKFGAVSGQTVRQMAQGVSRLFDSEIGLAVTGIAGPGGGTPEKPVGTVFIGLSACKEIFSGKHLFHGDRKRIKSQTAKTALGYVKRYIDGDTIVPGI